MVVEKHRRVHVHGMQLLGEQEDLANWPPLECCEVRGFSGSPKHALDMVRVHLKQDSN